METRKDIMWRLYVVYTALFLLSLAIFARVLYLQFVQGEMWREKARQISLRYFDIDPQRGNIYDFNGEFLATSVPIFEIRMDVASPNISDSIFRNNVDSLSYYLSRFFNDKTTVEYKKMLVTARQEKNRYLLLKRNINFDQLNEIRKFPIFRMGRNTGGLIADVKNKRVLPYRDLAYRTIGWDKPGDSLDVGIEGAYSKYLSGLSGRRLYQRIADGNWKVLNNDNEIEPVNGSDLISTIDIHLQDVAESALQKQLEANSADHGCAVLMEVSTGEIRAIANLKRTETGTYEERQNFAIWECTEPGSTFKMFSMLAALEDNKVELTDLVDVTGGTTKYANRTMRDSHLGGGVMTAQQAFEKSSNVGISKIIYKAYSSNPQAFIDRLYSFKVNEPLVLEIPGEIPPKIKNTKARSWSKVSLPWMSIGYEVALTPLQILTFYNAIANNGIMVKPHLIKEIRQGDKVTRKFGTEVINNRIASKEAIAKARQLLEGVVQNGTGSALKNPVYTVAGKTGTAQIAQNSAGYNKSNYKASFVGYFPAENPKYSCIVVINNPSKGVYYGGAISAPVFREIADRVYAADPDVKIAAQRASAGSTHLAIKSGLKSDIHNIYSWLGIPVAGLPAADWACTTGDSAYYKALTGSLENIPDVTGMGARDALYILEKLGLKVSIKGTGLVKKQSLLPGTVATTGSHIIIELES